MISITRNNIPEVLKNNQIAWTISLLNLVKEYKGYSKIPKDIRDSVVNNYRHEDIQAQIKLITGGKCVFCEGFTDSTGYMNVEHFYPKSLYPKFTFHWPNLVPACGRCNSKKGDSDTRNIMEIVNAEKEDPESFFAFDNLRIIPSTTSPNYNKSINTITLCDLQRVGLSREYSEILISFYDVEPHLKEAIDHYNKLSRRASLLGKATEIKDAVDNLKAQTRYDKQYAGFLRSLLSSSTIIQECIRIINNHTVDLNAGVLYKLSWK